MIPLTLPEFVVGNFLRLVVKPVLGPPFPIGVQRFWLEVSSLLSQPPLGVKRVRTQLGGVPAVAFTKDKDAAENPGDRPVVLYLHGGAFIVGSHRTHAGICGYLAKALDGVVYSVDYRLAPEFPFPAGYDDALAAYRALAAKTSLSNIIVAGDSAGGAMTADLLLALKDAGGELPAAGAMLSPAVGLDIERPAGAGPKDTFVSAGWAHVAMAAYGRDTGDPKNRILGRDLTGLPPIYLQYSDEEMLAAENRGFAADLRTAGVTTEVHVDQGPFHVLALLPGVMKRARTSIADIAAFGRAAITAAQQPHSAKNEVA